jgi:hypothetical protein
MRASIFSSVLAIFVPLVACSGAEDTSLISGGGNPSNQDGGPIVTGDSGPLPPGSCDLSKCGITVPTGFTLLTTVDPKNECPTGLVKRDAVAEPSVDPTACSCACNLTQQPDCTKGAIQRGIDYTNNATCNQAATTVTVLQSGCSQLPNPIQTQGWHYSAQMPSIGGVCSYDAKADLTKLKSRNVRLCDAPANCQGAVCGSNVCVAKDGDVACPPAFPNKQIVGKAANVECSSCGTCTVEGACGGTLSFYTDQQCAQGKRDFPVDGTCNASSANALYYSFQFQGSVKKAGCGGTVSPSTPTAKLDQPSTVCCQK